MPLLYHEVCSKQRKAAWQKKVAVVRKIIIVPCLFLIVNFVIIIEDK